MLLSSWPQFHSLQDSAQTTPEAPCMKSAGGHQVQLATYPDEAPHHPPAPALSAARPAAPAQRPAAGCRLHVQQDDAARSA